MVANDIDLYSLAAAAVKAATNDVAVPTVEADLLDTDEPYGVVLAGEVSYSRVMVGPECPPAARPAAAH